MVTASLVELLARSYSYSQPGSVARDRSSPPASDLGEAGAVNGLEVIARHDHALRRGQRYHWPWHAVLPSVARILW